MSDNACYLESHGKGWRASSKPLKEAKEGEIAYGSNTQSALRNLKTLERAKEGLRRSNARSWSCRNCNHDFNQVTLESVAECPNCRAGAQFVVEVSNVVTAEEDNGMGDFESRCLSAGAAIGIDNAVQEENRLNEEALQVAKGEARGRVVSTVVIDEVQELDEKEDCPQVAESISIGTVDVVENPFKPGPLHTTPQKLEFTSTPIEPSPPIKAFPSVIQFVSRSLTCESCGGVSVLSADESESIFAEVGWQMSPGLRSGGAKVLCPGCAEKSGNTFDFDDRIKTTGMIELKVSCGCGRTYTSLASDEDVTQGKVKLSVRRLFSKELAAKGCMKSTTTPDLVVCQKCAKNRGRD